MSKQEMHFPILGEKFPRTTVETTKGQAILPDTYAGNWFVLFSHPRDFTPVCTSEYESFSMAYGDFADIDCKLIGLSLDSVSSHNEWINWINEYAPKTVLFPIIGNHSARILAEKLGMVHEGYGKATVRSVFIVDKEGILRLMMYYPMNIGRSIKEILRVVKALQTSKKDHTMTPADWPDNEWVGHRSVFVKNPRNMEEKQILTRAVKEGNIESKASWFNYIPGRRKREF